MSTTTHMKIDHRTPSGEVIPKGTGVIIGWSQSSPAYAYFEVLGVASWAKRYNASVARLHRLVSGISKPPSMRTLQKWEEEGRCKTPSGHWVEFMDGFGPDGSPSWALVLGML